VGEIEVDLQNRSLKAGDITVHLTRIQGQLLYFLIGNVGRTLSREEIVTEIWGPDFLADSNIIDRHVHELRRLLQNSHAGPRFIETVPGVGYRFIPVSANGCLE